MPRVLRALHGLLLLALFFTNTAAAAAPAAADRLLAEMSQATWIAEGQGSRVVWIFFDPNCPYCHKLYERLRPWVGRDDLQLRWVPVGLLTATSEGKAAALLQGKDPRAALRQNENDFNFSAQGAGGGIAPATHIASKTRMALQANLSLLQGENIGGVPLMLFRTRAGAGELFIGAPSAARLAALLATVK